MNALVTKQNHNTPSDVQAKSHSHSGTRGGEGGEVLIELLPWFLLCCIFQKGFAFDRNPLVCCTRWGIYFMNCCGAGGL